MIKFVSTGFKYGLNFFKKPTPSYTGMINSILIDVRSLPDNKDIRNQDFFQEVTLFISDYIKKILKSFDLEKQELLVILACHSGENRSYYLCENLCKEFNCECKHWNGIEQNINILNRYIIYKNNNNNNNNNPKFSIHEFFLQKEIFELDYNNSELFKRRKLINQLKSIKV